MVFYEFILCFVCKDCRVKTSAIRYGACSVIVQLKVLSISSWRYSIISNLLLHHLHSTWVDIYFPRLLTVMWWDTYLLPVWSHLHFPKAFTRPHLSNSSATDQKCHNNPSSLICTWRVITDPINVLPDVEHLLLHNLTQHFQKMLRWKTFVQSMELFASESSPEKTLMVIGEFPV